MVIADQFAPPPSEPPPITSNSSPPSMSPPSVSPTPSPTSSSANVNQATSATTTPVKVNTNSTNATATPPTTTTPAATNTTTNTPRLQRVEFLYTATPVEGCDLLPYVVLRTPSGEVKSAESIEAKTRGALSVQYRWNRLAATYTCATKQCFKSAQQQFVPLLKLAAIHDLPKDQFDNVVKQSFYCSMKCLQNAWPTLRSYVESMSIKYPLKSNFNGDNIKSSINEDKNNENDETDIEDSETNNYDTKNSKSKAKISDDDDFQNEDDRLDASVRSHYVIGRNDGVFKDPLPNPIKIKEVAFIRNYAPTAADVGHILELVCRYVQRNSDGTVHLGPPLSIRSSTVLPLPELTPDRKMCNLSTGEYYTMTSNKRPGTFRVMTYNILAEIYATKEHFPEKQCPSWALAWTFRKRRLITEMTNSNSDILCMQEVQADHFEDHFQPYFQRKGYNSVFKGKTREAMGRKGKIDGCATFFKKDLFNLREQFVVEFNTIAQSRTKESRTLNRVLKGNVGQILILDTYEGLGPIIVANTHLYWDPDLADVKLFQVDAFIQELELLIQSRGLPQDIPIILTGDFNSTPESSVYELLTNGACMLSKNDIPEDCHLLNTCRLRHNLRMRSTYSHLGSEPQFTNYTVSFKGVLDYIWYSTDSIMATALLEVPSEAALLRNHAKELNEDERGIPNEHWSSDHIALVADFQLLKRNSLQHPTL